MTADELLAAARARIRRWTPGEVPAVVASGGLLVDIRPAEQRVRDGHVAGALVVDRNVLEWRFDLGAPWSLPDVRGHDQPVVVLCNEGYSSSLAAANLTDLGFVAAGDVEGGFVAWVAAGLPVVSAVS